MADLGNGGGVGWVDPPQAPPLYISIAGCVGFSVEKKRKKQKNRACG